MASDTETPSKDESDINLRWLVRLRWAMVVGQILTIAIVARGLGVELPLVPLGVIVAVEALSNLGAALWLRGPRGRAESTVALIVALDLLLFTGMLYFTGGPSNPFSFLYLIHLALAALVLRPVWTWALVALTLVCSGALFMAHVPLPMGHGYHGAHQGHEGQEGHEMHQGQQMHQGHQGHAAGGEFDLHLKGMWVALGVSATFIVYFVSRLRRELADREVDLMRAREKSVQSAQLAALGTLAAGAAHELASPLSTIAVAATELERSLIAAEGSTLDDVRLVKSQVARCRDVLSRLAADAGQTMGEVSQPTNVDAVIDRALSGLPGADRAKVSCSAQAKDAKLKLPLGSVAQALRNIVENALDLEQADVQIAADVDAERVTFRVTDDGPGMAEDVAARAREPFFTTKSQGRGLGLGLFLADTIASQLGGELTIESVTERGTSVTLLLPMTASA
jgi:two-component system sensor histidine kinase RegB